MSRQRPVVVATRFTDAEVRRMDTMRGSLNRAEYLRWVVLQALKAAETPQKP